MKNMMKKILFIMLVLFVSSCSRESNDNIIKTKQNLKATASKIDEDFRKIRIEVASLAEYTKYLYENSNLFVKSDNPKKYKVAQSGVLYKPENDGGSAVFVSGIIPVDSKIRSIVYFTSPLDSVFKDIMKRLPEVAQVYYNDRNSYNRIYPFFDVLSQYAPKLEIPDYNFYYLADEIHNPERSAVWVNDPYVDPAGRGWMVSAIAPVYHENELVGVPGIDVTISTVLERYISGNSMFIIFDAAGVLVAGDESSVSLLSMPPLTDHKYVETIKNEKFRKDDYNILRSKNSDIKAMAENLLINRREETELNIKGRQYKVFSEPIKEVNWNIIALIETGLL